MLNNNISPTVSSISSLLLFFKWSYFSWGSQGIHEDRCNCWPRPLGRLAGRHWHRGCCNQPPHRWVSALLFYARFCSSKDQRRHIPRATVVMKLYNISAVNFFSLTMNILLFIECSMPVKKPYQSAIWTIICCSLFLHFFDREKQATNWTINNNNINKLNN